MPRARGKRGSGYGVSGGYDATTNAREVSGPQVIEAELIDDEVRPVDDFVTRATGVGRSFVEDIASARALVNEGLGAVSTPSNITLSFGAAAGVAAGVALIGGIAGWYLRGQSTRRRRRFR